MLLARLVPIVAVVAAAQDTTIRVDLRLIEAHVIARDHRGPAGDLKESDFKIFDNGKEQQIAIFRVSKDTTPDRSQPKLPPGLFSNRVQIGGTSPTSATVLLIDTMNTATGDQLYAQKQVVQLLSTLDVKDPVALYVLADKLSVLQEFTVDAGALRKAMAAWKPVQSRNLVESQTPTPPPTGGSADALAARGYADIRAFANNERANATVDAFGLIARHLMSVPGRKNVVWVSGGFPYNLALERLSVLNQADVAIYPVDARGLIAFAGKASQPSGIDTMTEIADFTGGQAFYDTSDLTGAINKAMGDAQVTYTLGFYAKNEKPDGKLHELKVKTDRSGIDLKYRKAYYDLDTPSGDQDTSALLRKAADAPVDATAIGLGAVVVAGKDGKLNVAVMVDFRDLSLGKKDGHWKGGADLALVSQKADGTTMDLVSESLTFDMTDDAYSKRQREGFTLEEEIPAAKGLSRIRVVIVDRSTGAVGSVSANAPAQ